MPIMQVLKDLNSNQKFWRLLCYHYTKDLSSWDRRNRTFISWLTAKCIDLPAIPQFQLKKKQMRNVDSWGIEPQLSACKAEVLTIITKSPKYGRKGSNLHLLHPKCSQLTNYCTSLCGEQCT